MQHSEVQGLPIPDAASADHSMRVANHLRTLIGQGSISFARFMHEVLYAPGLGYYAAGRAKFGVAGDFVTAPESSPLFGRVLARQCAQVMQEIDACHILEFGAGSGKLAVQVLQRLAELECVPASYSIFEVSADLRDRQQALIEASVPQLADRVCWLSQLPAEHRGVVLANEVLDALPVERFVCRKHGLQQLCVAVDKEQFVLCEKPAAAPLVAAVIEIEQDLGSRLPQDYRSEVCLAARGWIEDLAAMLRAGVAFVFDYGVGRREYYAPDRCDGWLRCHFRHHAHDDALLLPGIQDLTAWVDFSAVARSAAEQGLDILAYVSQAHFLLNGGIDTELAGFEDLPPDAQLRLSAEVKLLTLPGEMGERFKCLGLGRGFNGTIDSFSEADRAHTL